MLKSTLIAAALALAALPAYAATAPMAKCDDASMAAMQTKVDGMTDAAMKKTAMKQMDMAKTAMKAHKAKDCAMHMNSAMKSMGTM
ncbi:hypothetical protein [Rhizobium sp. RAF56]|jgi:hypothetical protein|uniref:hypothetical protein n=1 Tax=Rhizobium sp. RAF56 TaxID=3233062 RepID=UPI003F9CAE70